MMATVAISSDFFKAFSRLAKTPQAKVSEFVSKFQANPDSSAINFEKIKNARDPNMRSVRIDQKYRGIVFKPKTGTVFMLLWVANHDDAYEWVRKHKCNINPDTGTIQIYAVSQLQEENNKIEKSPEMVAGVFDDLKDKELCILGVPKEQIELVRGVHNESELDVIAEQLPTEAYEGLFYILSGSRFDEVINERQLLVENHSNQTFDVNDFETALSRSGSQSQFVIVDDEVELQKMLNAPLQHWRVFLHASQRRLSAGIKNGAVRVLGGAGTGKTVVAMHRAKWLAENIAVNGKKVLFTTFTANLALDIKENLQLLCGSELMSRIEVINLDKWVQRFLRKKNYDFEISYGTEKYWQAAIDLAPVELNLPDSFYKEEWSRIIQPQSILDIEQYKRASRVGRGTRLNRLQRVKIWLVFEEYRALLTQDRIKEVDDAYRDAAALLQQDSSEIYASIVVDEAQDMGTQAFKLIRQLVTEGPNDIFIVGDGHQRIYGRNKVVLGQCGINIRGRASKLKINYRTTDEIRKWAVNLLDGHSVDDLDGDFDNQQGYKSLMHGSLPQLENFSSVNEQSDFIVRLLQKRIQEGISLHNICIVARVNSELEIISEVLKIEGIASYQLSANKSEQQHHDCVRLATMHRVKGLEFEEMILISLNNGVVPLSHVTKSSVDPVEIRQTDLEERALLYVAITRAKKRASLLSYGEVSSFLL